MVTFSKIAMYLPFDPEQSYGSKSILAKIQMASHAQGSLCGQLVAAGLANTPTSSRRQ